MFFAILFVRIKCLFGFHKHKEMVSVKSKLIHTGNFNHGSLANRYDIIYYKICDHCHKKIKEEKIHRNIKRSRVLTVLN